MLYYRLERLFCYYLVCRAAVRRIVDRRCRGGIPLRARIRVAKE